MHPPPWRAARLRRFSGSAQGQSRRRQSASHSSISGSSTAGSCGSGCDADSGCAADEGPDCSSSSWWHGEAGSNAPDRGSEPCSRLGVASWHSLTGLASVGDQRSDARSWVAAEGPGLTSLPVLGSLSWAGGAVSSGDSGGSDSGAADSRGAAVWLAPRSHSLDSTDGCISTRLRSSCFLGPPGGASQHPPHHLPDQALALPDLASASAPCWLVLRHDGCAPYCTSYSHTLFFRVLRLASWNIS